MSSKVGGVGREIGRPHVFRGRARSDSAVKYYYSSLDSRASSRRSSIVSTQGEDMDLGWLAWRDSRRSESRRSSVVSISGEDHGLRSVNNWTRAIKAAKREKEGR